MYVQVLFLSGLTLIIGPKKTFYFFARKQKIRGTVCFLGGIILVFCRWPFIGVIVETFGFLNLFGCVILSDPKFRILIPRSCSDFFPVILTFLRQIPFVGTFLTLPYVRDVSSILNPWRYAILTAFILGSGSLSRLPNVCCIDSC